MPIQLCCRRNPLRAAAAAAGVAGVAGAAGAAGVCDAGGVDDVA